MKRQATSIQYTVRGVSPDLWIAALALERDLVLITRDQHFHRIPQLLCR